ncbi:hypothetical protein SAMN03159473_04368 [Pseudomonas sp. NFACC52]|nr:hypothetical protein SAMN03159481_05241 [Pseudomonas sp. NFACC56-3]SFK87795.1 hypothetical protein SAMN03159473_04368 [Pseudomonas sp. NFACC52]
MVTGLSLRPQVHQPLSVMEMIFIWTPDSRMMDTQPRLRACIGRSNVEVVDVKLCFRLIGQVKDRSVKQRQSRDL